MMKELRTGASLIFWFLLILIVTVVWAMCPVSCDVTGEKARRTSCMNNLCQIGKAAAMCEMDYTNKMLSFQSITNYANSPKLFVCPSSGHKPGALSNLNQWTDYVLISGITTASPPRAVMGFCPPQNHGGKGGNILFVDGSVEWVNADKFWEIVRKGSKRGHSWKQGSKRGHSL